jgi:hypothetical protein
MVLWVVVGLWVVMGCQRKPVGPVMVTPAASSAAPTETVRVTATAMVTAVPTEQTPVDFWGVPAERLVVAEGIAYVAAGERGLHLFDMDEAGEPTAVASFDIEAWDVVASEEGVLVIGCQRRCVYTLDWSGDEPRLEEEVFQTNLFNKIVAVTVEGGMMYLAVERGIIKVVDMGERPWRIVQSQQMAGEIVDLDNQHAFLYVTVAEKGVYLFDVMEPTTLVERSFYQAPKPVWHEERAGVVYETVLDGDLTYVAAGSKGVRFLHHFVENENRQSVGFTSGSFYHVRGEATAVQWQAPFYYVKSWDGETEQYYLTVLRDVEESGAYIPINLIGEYAVGEDDPGRMVVWEGRVYFVKGGIVEFQLPEGYTELMGTHPISSTLMGPATAEVTFVRQMGGNYFSLAVQEHITYVGSGRILRVYDVNDAARPVEVHSLLFSESINEIKVHNGYAYLRMEGFETGYVLVLDISDPARPVEVARMPYFVQDIELEGDYAYVIIGYYTLGTSFLVWDVSDPADIQVLGEFVTTPRETVMGDNRYRMFDLAVSGETAYIAWGGYESCTHIECMGGLLILDLVDKANPVEKGVFFLGSLMASVTVSGDTVFGVDAAGQLLAFDVADMANPTVLSILEVSVDKLWDEMEVSMVVAGDALWVAANRDGLRRFDLRDLTGMREESGYQRGAIAQGVVTHNNLVYLVSGGVGLEVLEVDGRDEVVPLTSVPAVVNATDVVVSGTVAYIADDQRGIMVWDVTDPLNLTQWGSTLQGSQNLTALTIEAGKLYALSTNLSEDVFAPNRSVDVFDISQPLTPTYQLTLPFEVDSFVVYDGMAYVIDDDQLSIWNIANLESPELLGAYRGSANLGGVAVTENKVYVSVDWNVLLVLDVSDLAHIRPVYSIDEVQGLPPWIFGVYGLKVVGDRLYFICDWSGLCIFDISNPSRPVFLGTIPGIILDFEVVGSDVYALREGSHVTCEVMFEAYDASNPTHLRQISDLPEEFVFSFDCNGGLAVANGVVYAAIDSGGLLIFEHVRE